MSAERLELSPGGGSRNRILAQVPDRDAGHGVVARIHNVNTIELRVLDEPHAHQVGSSPSGTYHVGVREGVVASRKPIELVDVIRQRTIDDGLCERFRKA